MLRDVAARALAWVDARRDRFALPPEVVSPETDLNWTLKPLGELAQLTASIRRHTESGDPLHDGAGELLEFAWRETGKGAMLVELFRLDPHATYPLEIYAAFSGAGFRSAVFEEFADVVTRTRSWRLLEQDPNRRLGILNAERRCGLPPHARTEDLLPATWLGGLPEPWTFERHSGYALTHTVFHLADWGAASHAVPGRVADYLHLWLPSWLDTCLDSEQWDLGCELLAVGACLPTPYPAEHRAAAWGRIAAARAADGSLREEGGAPAGAASGPGPGVDLSPDPDEATAFAHRYHSTLAAAFAAVLTAHRLGDRPPRTTGAAP
nr:hypothetical protein [Streptomyces boncukensis]